MLRIDTDMLSDAIDARAYPIEVVECVPKRQGSVMPDRRVGAVRDRDRQPVPSYPDDRRSYLAAIQLISTTAPSSTTRLPDAVQAEKRR